MFEINDQTATKQPNDEPAAELKQIIKTENISVTIPQKSFLNKNTKFPHSSELFLDKTCK